MTPADRRRQFLERDLLAALYVPEAAAPGVVDYLLDELARLDAEARNTKRRPAGRSQRGG